MDQTFPKKASTVFPLYALLSGQVDLWPHVLSLIVYIFCAPRKIIPKKIRRIFGMENGQMPVFFRYPDGKKEIRNLR